MQRKLLIIVTALLPVATAACSESCAQSRYGKPPVITHTDPGPTKLQVKTPSLNGSLQVQPAPQLKSDLSGTATVVVPTADTTTTATNVIVKDPAPPPEGPPEAHHDEGEENDSDNAITCN